MARLAQPVGAGGTGRIADTLVAGKYRVGKKIGAGSFGEIYHCQNEHSGELLAMKVELGSAKYPQLINEATVYKTLNSGGPKIGLPKLHWYGTEGEYNVLIIELLGPSLEDLFVFCKRRFSVKTVLLLADQMLGRIEVLHRHNYLHRDIKPDNFLMGLGKNGHVVYSIDLGLAKRFVSHNHHIPYKDGKSLAGTARYVSINTHQGYEQARRDDIESIGYVLLYFLRGGLPWQNVKAATKKEKYEQISKKKSSTSVEKLCSGCPTEFAYCIHYARGLKFEEEPAYAKIRNMFRQLYHRCFDKVDYEYDWILMRQKLKSDLTQSTMNSFGRGNRSSSSGITPQAPAGMT
ncbi:Casein kinase I isoform alpha [Diplonema papillatum]|nr:Casein kinase I isoform alpha [Diplonema papillatum]KAJ9444453.1 Casein kinase I isoform alpha [Diplonema papillatum]